MPDDVSRNPRSPRGRAQAGGAQELKRKLQGRGGKDEYDDEIVLEVEGQGKDGGYRHNHYEGDELIFHHTHLGSVQWIEFAMRAYG